MKILMFTILVTILLVCFGSAQSHCPQPKEAEDTKDGIARYVVRFDSHGASKNAEVRDMLWCHWHKRIPGRLVVTWYSLEGQASVNSFTFADDEAGTWSLKVNIDRGRTSRTPPAHNEYRAYIIQRVLVHPGPSTRGESPIPEGKELSGESYRLSLRGKDNELLTHI